MRKGLKTNRSFATCTSKSLFDAIEFVPQSEGEVKVTALVTQSCPALCDLWTVHSSGPHGQ